MTGSGKTVWVQSLLQQAQTVIDQAPERIIWCYSHWQNAYTQLLMMIPTIEFVKGIPESLENDSYLDVNKRNLIVIDDQMIEAGKDNRIVNLFTKGSHQGRSQGGGGSWGARDPPFVSLFVSRQPTIFR